MNNYKIGPLYWSLDKNINWTIETSKLFQISGVNGQERVWNIFANKVKDFSDFDFSNLLFSSGGSWEAYRSGKSFLIAMENNGQPETILMFDSDSNSACLHYKSECNFKFPQDELFALYGLSRQRALFSHSCSLFVGGKSYLFCGVSGAGKSTMAEALDGQSIGPNLKIQVGSDERNILYSDVKGAPAVAASPWYGTGYFSQNLSAPVAGIFVLDKSHSDLSLEKVPPETCVGALMRSLFLPQFDKAGIGLALDGLEDILTKVPVYSLNYNKQSVDILSFLSDKIFSQEYEIGVRDKSNSNEKVRET